MKCSICKTDEYIIVASSDGGGFFFEDPEDKTTKHYCDFCFEKAHGGDTKYCVKRKKLQDSF